MDSSSANHRHNHHSATYEPYPIYAMTISPSPSLHRVAIGSLSFDSETLSLTPSPSLSFDHPYPLPSSSSTLLPLTSSADFARLHNLSSPAAPPTVLDNSKSSEFFAPPISFDRNDVEPNRIGTSSVDTTCTVWDFQKSAVETQLIAHDKEIHDIEWGEGRVFASVSSDASVWIFDLRNKDHSTITYENLNRDTPFRRLAWNQQGFRYISTILMDSSKVVVLDIRSPAVPLAELEIIELA